MDPYEKARDETIRQNQRAPNFLKKVGSTAASAATAFAGASLASKVAPFLSEFIPQSLAIKGLSKINPKLGKFVSQALEEGSPFEEIKEFISSKLPGNENEEEEGPAKQDIEKQAPSQPNLLGQFSPELQSFIEQGIQAGKSPDHAAALAMPRAEFAEIIKGIEKQSKKKFTQLVRELYEGKAVEQPESKAALQGKGQQDLSGWTKGLNPNLKQFERPEQSGAGQQGAIGNQLLEAVKEARRIRGK